jgi:small subunit ribosomal protein S16
MATIIKMQRHGAPHKSFWRIVVTDSRKPKDCIELLGTYDQHREPAAVKIDQTKAVRWLGLGAIPTPTVHRLLQKQGITRSKPSV